MFTPYQWRLGLVTFALSVALTMAHQCYVDPHAQSGGDGSESKPFLSLSQAINATEGPCDVIILAPGRYTGVDNIGIDIGSRSVISADTRAAVFQGAGEPVDHVFRMHHGVIKGVKMVGVDTAFRGSGAVVDCELQYFNKGFSIEGTMDVSQSLFQDGGKLAGGDDDEDSFAISMSTIAGMDDRSAIMSLFSIAMENVNVFNNRAESILRCESAHINNCRFQGNVDTKVVRARETLIMESTIISDNVADTCLYLEKRGFAQLSNCTIANNSAHAMVAKYNHTYDDDDDDLYYDETVCSPISCTFDHEQTRGPQIVIKDSTIENNTCSDYSYSSWFPAQIELHNSWMRVHNSVLRGDLSKDCFQVLVSHTNSFAAYFESSLENGDSQLLQCKGACSKVHFDHVKDDRGDYVEPSCRDVCT